MRRTLIDRRDFIKTAGAVFLAGLTPVARAAADRADAVYATAFQRRDGGFGAALLSEAGALIDSIALPDRGHDISFDPGSRRSVVFARQPGTFAVVIDHAGRTPPLTLSSAPGRHFYGHGVFSPTGDRLYATENDFDNAAGMVGIYDARAGFTRIGEFPTHGVGPHEMLLLDDGGTLAIANGGIETHPDFGRAKLNIPSMQPSLVFIDRVSGDLIERQALPDALHQLSIRHMDIAADGSLWFGCQYEGAATDRPGLVGRARRGETLALIDMPETVLSGLRNYVGSVAANRAAGIVAVSSPQGNSLAVFDTSSRSIVSTTRLVEVCGIAPDDDGFLATTGTGSVVRTGGGQIAEPDYVWDNHVTRINL